MDERTGAGPRPPRRGRDWLLAALAALVVAALAAGLAQRTRALSVAHQELEDWPLATDLAVALHTDLQIARDLVEHAARSEKVGGPIPGVALQRVEGGHVTTGDSPAESALSDRDLGHDDVRALLARAVDSAESVQSPPVELEAGPRLLVIAPSYGSGVVPDNLSLLQRRASLEYLTVAVVDPKMLMDPHLPSGTGGVVTFGDTEFVAASGRPHAGAAHVIDLDGYRISLRVGSTDRAPVSATLWLILALGALAAAASAVAVLRLRDRLGDQQAAIARGDAQAELIADVAPVVQQSLDLADVLPSIAVQLQDRFGLDGVHLSVGATSSDAVEVFGLGERPLEAQAPLLAPPDALRAGEAVVLALQRGGRSVALLELVAGRDLHSDELRSLRVLTELVTAAVVNANLYASQQDAVRRLRDLDALKTVFLSTASHELRTPATAIGGFASLLNDRWDSFPEDRRREMVERIAANARSLGAVVEDLLDFSLLDRREQPLPTAPTDLEALVRNVVARLAPLFTGHVIEVKASPAPSVVGEQNALERVVTNLLTNAAKFSPAGSTVTVAVAAAPGGTTLVVSDQGPGVPDDDRARIFTRFYRGSGEAVVQTRGVGIGLSVVLELVERLSGRVEVDDAPGGGARFTVWLPVAAPPDGRDGTAVAREVQDASSG